MVRKAAGPSVGSIILKCASSSLVSSANQLAYNGLIFQVSVGGSYANGAAVPIVSVDIGLAANIPEGTILQWILPPSGASSTALVNVGGLIDGVDAEDDDALFKRFVAYCSTPPGNGNAQHLNALAESATTGIQSFCFPAFNGPATMKLCVIRQPTDTNKNRDVDTLTIASLIVPTVVGSAPEHCDISISTVSNQPTDISLGLSLTSNQWIDKIRFPAFGTSPGTGVWSTPTSSTSFALASPIAPSPGISHIAWFSQTDWTLYRAKVLTSSLFITGVYSITIDQPFPGIANSDLVMPDSINLQSYCDAFLAYMAQLGPGECTDQAGLLPRSLRRPFPSVTAPSAINLNINKALTNFAEVGDSDTLAISLALPSVPSLLTSNANILVPRRIAFFELT